MIYFVIGFNLFSGIFNTIVYCISGSPVNLFFAAFGIFTSILFIKGYL